ncbi:MAG: hypothetical protein IH599_05835 [Bacteroidales bacterium]|nr:hypothetical protein [Bacteroidales bacterium]
MASRDQYDPNDRLASAAGVLVTDLHSHVLPGIDDGARYPEDSLAMLSLLRDLGYKKVITTPHVMTGAYPNTISAIQEAEARLRAEEGFASLGIELQVAAEYMLDEGFGGILAGGDILSFGDRFVLMECSFQQPWPGYRELVFELQLQEFTPVLAHPERYLYWQADPRELLALSDAGVLFQVNLMSLAGRYGPGVRRHAERMLKEGRVSFLGSDLHTVNTAAYLKQGLATPSASAFAPYMLNAGL